MTSFFQNSLSAVTTAVSNVRKGDGDGDTPDDTFVCRTLRAYYANPEKSRKYPYWPEWIPGPRPASLPAPAQVSNVGSSYGVDRYSGQRQGSAQEAGSNPYMQQEVGGINGHGQSQQAPSARPNEALKGLWNKPRAPPNAAARGGSSSLRSTFDKKSQRPEPPKPEPRPIPSQRDYSQQGRSQDQQSYSNRTEHDPYNYNTSRTGGSGYESRGRPANGYGSSSGTAEQPYVTANAPWSSGASRGGNGGYSEPGGYEQPSSRSTPNSLRTGRGLPGGLPMNPRSNR